MYLDFAQRLIAFRHPYLDTRIDPLVERGRQEASEDSRSAHPLSERCDRPSDEEVRYIEVKARAGTGKIAMTEKEWFTAQRYRERERRLSISLPG